MTLVRTVLAVIAAAGALSCAPLATADPDQQCNQQQQQQPLPGDDQQQQCNRGPGLPDLPNRPNNNDQQQPQQQAPQQQPQPTPQQQPKQGDLGDKNCWVVNGVPRWNAPGTAPLPTGPGDVVSWCPTTYGLTPH